MPIANLINLAQSNVALELLVLVHEGKLERFSTKVGRAAATYLCARGKNVTKYKLRWLEA